MKHEHLSPNGTPAWLAALKKKPALVVTVCGVAIMLTVTATLLAVSNARQNADQSGSISSAASSTATGGDYTQLEDDKDYESVEIDTEAFSGTVLPETEDAGESYVKETLFIGDSNSYRYMNYGFNTLENNVSLVGLTANELTTKKFVKFKGGSTLYTVVEAVKKMQPKRVVIGIGTNNLYGNVDDYIKVYTKAIKKIYDAYPYFDIIVNAVPPVDKNRTYPVKMQQIDAFNEALVQMCEDNGWKFLNSTEALKDEKTGFCKEGYTIVTDGLHLSKEGVTALFHYIRTHAVETEDRRPKPLKSVPKRDETPPEIITKDPLKRDEAQVTKVAVSFTAGEGGSISGLAEQSIEPGKTAEQVTAVPNEGYQFAGWSCTTGSIPDTSNPVLSFTVPGNAADYGGVFVTAAFKPIGYSVRFTLSSMAGGKLMQGETGAESVSVAVNSGKTAAVVLKLNEGYTVETNGTYTLSKNADGTYTVAVENVKADLEITVKLVQLATPTPTPTPLPSATPEATPSASPEATPSTTPEATPESTPAATPESTPEPTPVTTPEPTAVPTEAPTPEPTPVPVVETPAPPPSDNGGGEVPAAVEPQDGQSVPQS